MVDLFSNREEVREMVKRYSNAHPNFVLWFYVSGELRSCRSIDDVTDYLCRCQLGDVFNLECRLGKQIRQGYFMVDSDSLIPISHELYLVLSNKS